MRYLLHSKRLLLLYIGGLGLIILVYIGTPKAWTAGDFAGPLEAASDIVNGHDPLAVPPINDRFIPYPLTAATFVLPLLMLPRSIISVLVVIALLAALHLLTDQHAPMAPGWGPLFLCAYVPLIFNLQLIQWAPLFLLALGLHQLLIRAADQGKRGAWIGAGIVCVPLVVKAQLAPIVAFPVLAVLVLERRWRILIVTLAGWGLLFGLSLLFRPMWPFVWLDQIRPFAGTYPAPAFADWWVGIPTLFLAVAAALMAWKHEEKQIFRVALIIAVSLVVPQRAIYETAILIAPLTIILRRPGLALLVVGISWSIPLQPLLHIEPNRLLLLAVFLPITIAVWMMLWPTHNAISKAVSFE